MKDTNKRKYDSSRRKSQAKQTRGLIFDAARDLFIKKGYSGATIKSIAEKAGVSPESIYAIFKNKQTLLTKLMSFSLVGDEEPTPIFERSKPQEILHLTNQEQQIEQFAEDISKIIERVAPLFAVIREASRTEPRVLKMFNGMLSERAENMKVVVNALLSNGPLRQGVGQETAAETIWVMTSGEVFTLLVKEREWPREKYVDWLSDGLKRLLLP